jgi:transcriptional regulator GlxA family with amidase domain
MRTIGFFLFPDFNILDVAGPLAAFDVPRHEVSPTPYRLVVYSKDGGDVMSSCGVSMNTIALNQHSPDTFVICGGRGAIAASQCAKTITLVQRTARRARRIASVCSGAFVLAKAGLLSGRRATTQWEYAARRKQEHPDIRVESDQIFTRDAELWTSGGVTAGIDLSLAIIEDDLGLAMAQRTARVLVVYHRRIGGQAQFSAMLEMEPATDRLRRALQFAREHLHEPLPVERLAESVHVGPRQLSRLFLKETGETPAKAVERLRTEAAHAQLTDTTASIAAIARQVGFENAERMRRAFVRIYGNPPQAVRRIATAA